MKRTRLIGLKLSVRQGLLPTSGLARCIFIGLCILPSRRWGRLQCNSGNRPEGLIGHVTFAGVLHAGVNRMPECGLGGLSARSARDCRCLEAFGPHAISADENDEGLFVLVTIRLCPGSRNLPDALRDHSGVRGTVDQQLELPERSIRRRTCTAWRKDNGSALSATLAAASRIRRSRG